MITNWTKQWVHFIDLPILSILPLYFFLTIDLWMIFGYDLWILYRNWKILIWEITFRFLFFHNFLVSIISLFFPLLYSYYSSSSYSDWWFRLRFFVFQSPSFTFTLLCFSWRMLFGNLNSRISWWFFDVLGFSGPCSHLVLSITNYIIWVIAL